MRCVLFELWTMCITNTSDALGAMEVPHTQIIIIIIRLKLKSVVSPTRINVMHSLMYSIFPFIFMIDIGFAIKIFNNDNGKFST